MKDAELRLDLYRRAARALNAFCSRWVWGFCERCLEVTRDYHRNDPRADVELVAGTFPGCCHAGAGDAFYVPGLGEGGHMPQELRDSLLEARGSCPGSRDFPLTYRIRERRTRRAAAGVACVHLSVGGCVLRDLKGPICLTYICEPVRDVLLCWGKGDVTVENTDDLAGSGRVLGEILTGERNRAETAVAALEGRLTRVGLRIQQAGFEDSASLCRWWLGPGASPV